MDSSERELWILSQWLSLILNQGSNQWPSVSWMSKDWSSSGFSSSCKTKWIFLIHNQDSSSLILSQNKPKLFLLVCSTSFLKTLWERGENALERAIFLIFPKHFIPFWRTIQNYMFFKFENYGLQTLSIWNWERLNKSHRCIKPPFSKAFNQLKARILMSQVQYYSKCLYKVLHSQIDLQMTNYGKCWSLTHYQTTKF